MKKSDKHFLGRGGRVFGPFTAHELEALRASGELSRYTYEWDAHSHTWKNIDPHPPHPRPEGFEKVEAICHNFDAVVAGTLTNVTDSGCVLLSRDPSDAPKLALNARLFLNVIDSSAKKGMNVEASLEDVSRTDGVWVYRLRWDKRPTF